MYVVQVNYTAPVDEIDYVLADHNAWLNRQYEAGHFIVSGYRKPHAGCVIIARSMPRGKLDALLASDPFAVRRLARYEVIEFSATRTVNGLLDYNEAIAS